MSGAGYAAGTVRVWDGSAWRFATVDWQDPVVESIKVGAVSALIATTTTCSRTPATIHKGASVTITASTTGRNGGNIDFQYFSSGGVWVKFATKAAPVSGGNVSVTHAPGYSVNYRAVFTGSSTHKASTSASAGTVTVQTLHTDTKTVNVGWVQAYNGAGNKISGSGRDGAIHQGYYSSTHGNRKSLLRFDPNLPAGATVSKVIFDCNSGWDHWYNNDGGTIVVGSLIDQNTEPATFPGSAKADTNRSRKAVNKPSWEIDITSWADTVVTRSDFSGLCVGPGPTTSKEYYGYSVASPSGNFQLRITHSWWA
jgi:hypothetical protein